MSKSPKGYMVRQDIKNRGPGSQSRGRCFWQRAGIAQALLTIDAVNMDGEGSPKYNPKNAGAGILAFLAFGSGLW